MKTPEITFIVTYECPRCSTLLEWRGHGPTAWQRCPQCGRPSLPPKSNPARPPEPVVIGPDVLVIGPEAAHPTPSLGTHSEGTGGYSGAVRRVVLAVGFLTSLTLLITAFLEQNAFNVMIFGLATIVLFGLLALVGRRH